MNVIATYPTCSKPAPSPERCKTDCSYSQSRLADVRVYRASSAAALTVHVGRVYNEICQWRNLCVAKCRDVCTHAGDFFVADGTSFDLRRSGHIPCGVAAGQRDISGRNQIIVS